MIAVRILRLDAKKINAGLGNRERHPCSHAAVRLEIQRELSLGHHILREVGQRLLADLIHGHNVVMHAGVLDNLVRIKIVEHELERERLLGFDLGHGASLTSARGGILID